MEGERPAASVGQALISQDHIAVAMALAFQQRFPDSGHFVVSVVLIGIIRKPSDGTYLAEALVCGSRCAIDLKG